MGNKPKIEIRLATITYQLLKNYPQAINFTIEQRMAIIQSIYDAVVDSGDVFDNPELFKPSALDIDIAWSSIGTTIYMSSGTLRVMDTLTDDIVPIIAEQINTVYVNGEPLFMMGYEEDDYLVFLDGNEIYPPEVDNVVITGAPWVSGNIMTGTYDWGGTVEEGNSTYKWYVCDDLIGTNDVMLVGYNDITFNTAIQTIGKYIKFTITPENINGEVGKTRSAFAGPITI